MKIAIMSTYHQECGIAEYAEKLRFGFEHNGHEVKILGNYQYAPLVSPDDDNVFRCFHMEIRDQKNDWDVEGAIKHIGDSDVLLIQYEACLYPSSTFNQALDKIRHFCKCKVFVVFHSSCIWPSFPWDLIDVGIAHNEGIMTGIGSTRVLIRHGVEDYPDIDAIEIRGSMGLEKNKFTFGSFGLGRVHYEVTIPTITSMENCQYMVSTAETEKVRIQEIIEKLSPEQRKNLYYYPDYVPRLELIRRLQACDALFFDYYPIDANVCSGAARMAVGCRRKTITSDTNWFRDLPASFVYKIKPSMEVEEMKQVLGKVKEHILQTGVKITKEQEDYINVMCNSYINEIPRERRPNTR